MGVVLGRARYHRYNRVIKRDWKLRGRKTNLHVKEYGVDVVHVVASHDVAREFHSLFYMEKKNSKMVYFQLATARV